MERAAPRQRFSALNIFYFLAGLALLIFLLRQIDFSTLLQLVVQIQPGALLLGGLAYLGKAGLRSYRIRKLNQASRLPLLKVLRLSLASSLASQLLPLKLGEFAYVYLLKKEHDSSLEQGLSSLLLLRIFDLLAIASLFIVASAFARISTSLAPYFYAVAALIGILAIGLAILLGISRLETPLTRLATGLGLVKFQSLGKLLARLDTLLATLRQYDLKTYFQATLLAWAEWAINFAVFYIILWGIGLPASWFETITAVTLSALASVLPINSFGNFGTQEAGWATAMLLAGYSRETALLSGFASHLLTLGYMLLFGGLAWLTYWAENLRTQANVVKD